LKFPAGAVKLSKSSLKICALAEVHSAKQVPATTALIDIGGIEGRGGRSCPDQGLRT